MTLSLLINRDLNLVTPAQINFCLLIMKYSNDLTKTLELDVSKRLASGSQF